MSEIDVAKAAKESSEIFSWMISISIAVFLSTWGLLWFFVRKVFGDKEKQIFGLFVELRKEIEGVKDLIKEAEKATAMTNADTYRRLGDVVASFEKRAEALNKEIHGLEMGVRLAQEKVLLIAEVQKDLKDISARAIRLETTMISMEKIVEKFGKVILKP